MEMNGRKKDRHKQTTTRVRQRRRRASSNHHLTHARTHARKHTPSSQFLPFFSSIFGIIHRYTHKYDVHNALFYHPKSSNRVKLPLLLLDYHTISHKHPMQNAQTNPLTVKVTVTHKYYQYHHGTHKKVPGTRYVRIC